MTLMELTGHEAGIVCYGGNTVAVVNWSRCDDDALPVLGPFGTMLDLPENEGTLEKAESTYRRFADVRNELPGSVWLSDETDGDGNRLVDTDMDIVYDYFGDLTQLFCGVDCNGKPLTAADYEGGAYTLPDGRKILVIDTWA